MTPTRYVIEKAASYLQINRDSALRYAEEGLQLAIVDANDTLIAQASMIRGEALYGLGDFPEAYSSFRRWQQISLQQMNHQAEAQAWSRMGECLMSADSVKDAVEAFEEAFIQWQAVGDQEQKAHARLRKGRALELRKQTDAARNAYIEGLKIARRSRSFAEMGLAEQYLGYLYLDGDQLDLAMQHLRSALMSFEKVAGSEQEVAVTLSGLGKVAAKRKRFVVARNYGEQGLKIARDLGSRELMMDFYQLLGDVMAGTGDFEHATDYYKLNALIRDSLSGNATARELSEVVLKYEKEKALLEKQKAVQQNALQEAQLALRDAEIVRRRTWSNFILGGLVVVLAFVGFLIYAFVQKNRANRRLERALADLNTAQDQLVRSEKLASLGQVTAGIAHEIRNPLNFVNSLSKLSVGMVDELAEELHEIEGKPLDPPKVRLLMEYFADIRGNAQKVLEHGERASRIVRDMLQHSAVEESERTEFEVNELVEEYLKVAFHSQPLKASEGSSVTCDMRFEGDPKAGKIKALRPEIGRALLNIMVNAFEAVLTKQGQAPADYQPQVHVRTERLANGVRITIRDNGPGIGTTDQQKVFDPFFTTKPPNKGTGLGLSLAHESIVRKHKGKIEMQSAPGEGTTFVVFLPAA
ncbi:MAG: ATP-binding protein [Bacteroidia bacterium]